MNIYGILDSWDDFGIVAGHSDRTRASKRGTILRLHTAGIDPIHATTTQLITWLASQKINKNSRSTYRAHLNAFYSWVVTQGHRQDNPIDGIPAWTAPRGLPRPLSDQDIIAILDACSHQRAFHTRTYILFASLAGLRVHEIAKLQGRDVDITHRRLMVTGKGGRTAAIPLHDALVDLAREYPRTGWWFPSPSHYDDGHVSRVSVSQAIARAMRRAGVRGTPHQLRHSFGSHIYTETGDLGITQRALRHADVRTTMIYAHVDVDKIRSAVEQLPDLAA